MTNSQGTGTGPAPASPERMTEAEFQRLYDRLRAQPPWGPADIVSDTGAAELSIAAAADGIVGRGVLLDVPRARGVPWLEPGDHVTADDLAAAERDQQVQVGQGDLVFIRVGHRLRRFQLGPGTWLTPGRACIRRSWGTRPTGRSPCWAGPGHRLTGQPDRDLVRALRGPGDQAVAAAEPSFDSVSSTSMSLVRASMRARWVKACGKFPSCCPVVASNSSE